MWFWYLVFFSVLFFLSFANNSGIFDNLRVSIGYFPWPWVCEGGMFVFFWFICVFCYHLFQGQYISSTLERRRWCPSVIYTQERPGVQTVELKLSVEWKQKEQQLKTVCIISRYSGSSVWRFGEAKQYFIFYLSHWRLEKGHWRRVS